MARPARRHRHRPRRLAPVGRSQDQTSPSRRPMMCEGVAHNTVAGWQTARTPLFAARKIWFSGLSVVWLSQTRVCIYTSASTAADCIYSRVSRLIPMRWPDDLLAQVDTARGDMPRTEFVLNAVRGQLAGRPVKAAKPVAKVEQPPPPALSRAEAFRRATQRSSR
jgi:hypothetical protein